MALFLCYNYYEHLKNTAMKKIIKASIYTFTSLCIIMLSSMYAIAQDAVQDTLPESAYNMQVPKRVVNVYSDFVPYVLFGIVLAGMAYLSYRLWADNRPAHDDFTNHHLEH